MLIRRLRAFTLIELLISITIIGLLAGIVVISVNTARKSARDTRRKADINLLAVSFEQYRASRQQYPPDSNGDYQDFNDDVGRYTESNQFLTALITERLVSRVPNDPRFEEFKVQSGCGSGQNCDIRYHHSYSYRTSRTSEDFELCFGSTVEDQLYNSGKGPTGRGFMLITWLENVDDPDAPKALTSTVKDENNKDVNCQSRPYAGKTYLSVEGKRGYDAAGNLVLYTLAK